MIETLELSDAEGDIARAGELLRTGNTVVFPTETVYGLGANACSSQAVQGIYRAKGRPADNPLIVHVADLADLKGAASRLKPEESLLFSTFSPGPLTLIVERSASLCPEVSAGLSTVGLRIPSHPLARKILKQAGVPVAAPSANRSGRPSPTDFDMAWAEMNGHAGAVVHGGPSTLGLESSIVWLNNNQVHVLRPGAISGHAVLRVLRDAGYSYELAAASNADAPRAPGTRYRHYSPRARVHLWTSDHVPVSGQAGEFWFFLGPSVAFQGLPDSTRDRGTRLDGGSTESFAHHLYRHLVAADHQGASDIALWLEPSLDPEDPRAGLVEALRDRCRRAASLQ